MENNQVRVLLLDNNRWVRQQLSRRLEREPNIRVVGTGDVSPDCLPLFTSLTPDVVLLESKTGNGMGLQLCRELACQFPGIAILILTSFEDIAEKEAVLKAGARAYLLKQLDNRELVRVLQGIAARNAEHQEQGRRKDSASALGDRV